MRLGNDRKGTSPLEVKEGKVIWLRDGVRKKKVDEDELMDVYDGGVPLVWGMVKDIERIEADNYRNVLRVYWKDYVEEWDDMGLVDASEVGKMLMKEMR